MMKNLKYRELLFAEVPDPKVDVSEIQTTVGLRLKIGEDFWLDLAYNFSQLGAEKETLDASVCSYPRALSKSGMEQDTPWSVDYRYTDNTHKKIEEFIADGGLVDLEYHFPNGTYWSNKGKCSGNFVQEAGVNAVINATVSFELSEPKWTPTYATKG